MKSPSRHGSWFGRYHMKLPLITDQVSYLFDLYIHITHHITHHILCIKRPTILIYISCTPNIYPYTYVLYLLINILKLYFLYSIYPFVFQKTFNYHFSHELKVTYIVISYIRFNIFQVSVPIINLHTRFNAIHKLY